MTDSVGTLAGSHPQIRWSAFQFPKAVHLSAATTRELLERTI